MNGTKKLKVLFVGVGSIAKRHIRNLRKVCDERKIEIEIDALRRVKSLDAEGIDCTYCDKELLPIDYDIIFITNPTEFHLETLTDLHNHGKHFFIEKPICSVAQLEKATTIIGNINLRKDSVYYVACPLRYTSVIRYLKDNINTSDVLSVRCISSSYLPDWRPGQDYRDTYSAHADLGGGVDIDLIHEWDYMSYLFGWPSEVKSLIGRTSKLEIDSNDFAIYVAKYDNKIAELHLDYFGRKTIRKAMLIMEDDTIEADLVSNKVTYLKEGRVIELSEDRDEYQKRELEFFLDQIEKKEFECENDTNSETDYGIAHAIKVMKLTQGE